MIEPGHAGESAAERVVREPRVRVEGLSYRYRHDRLVLDAIAFEVRSGEVVGLIGRNGSGKTTCLRLLAGLLVPAAGRIDVTDRPAVVTDRTPFLEPLTARENILGILALCGRSGADADRLAESSLRRFGLLGDADRPVEEFSLGMRRRLALAEGFAMDRKLLLLDEPTLGLDPAARDLLAAILSEAPAHGAAAVLASNDAEFAERTCDRVVLLHGGRIAASGDPEEMIAELEAPTLLEIRVSGPPPDSVPPDGLAVVARSASGLTLSSTDASRRLPAVWAWLESAGCPMREVKIRSPGLADVFRAHTGEELPAPRESA